MTTDIDTENTKLRERIADLEDQLDMLQEELRQLKSNAQGTDLELPFEWQLTSKESAVMRVLLTREQANKQQIYDVIYGDSLGQETQPKIIDVFVCKIRKKLTPHGITIKTIWGRGYSIDAETRARFK